MTTEKHCKLQRGCHTFAIFFRNLQRPRWKLFTTLSPPAWNLLRAKDGLWLPNFHKIALQVSMDMSHTGYIYFSCNSQRNILLPLQVAKLGCYTWNLSCNLPRNKKLQEKLPRVTWPYVTLASACLARALCSFRVPHHHAPYVTLASAFLAPPAFPITLRPMLLWQAPASRELFAPSAFPITVRPMLLWQAPSSRELLAPPAFPITVRPMFSSAC